MKNSELHNMLDLAKTAGRVLKRGDKLASTKAIHKLTNV
jgi:hypothetical protein